MRLQIHYCHYNPSNQHHLECRVLYHSSHFYSPLPNIFICKEINRSSRGRCLETNSQAGRSLLSLSAVFTTLLVKSTLNLHIELLTAATNIVSPQPHSLAANHRLSSDLFWPSDFPHNSSSSFVPFVNNISLSNYFRTLTLNAPKPRYNVLLITDYAHCNGVHIKIIKHRFLFYRFDSEVGGLYL